MRPAVAVVLVTLLAGGLRFWDLGQPDRRVFDEIYYSKSGCLYVGYPRDTCRITSDTENYWVDTYGDVSSWVHPPLGKWLIGLGQLAFGPDPFGWRVAAALAGTLTVAAVAMMAQLLFRRSGWTYVAGLLLAVEHLSFVQSRVAMLDVFLAMFVAFGFLLLLLDRRWIERRTTGSRPVEAERDAELLPIAGGSVSAPPAAVGTRVERRRTGRVPSPVLRPWRLLAGVVFGAAVATKWSALSALVGAVLLSLLWERTRRNRAHVARPTWRAVQQEGFGIVLSLLLVPVAVYWASYLGYFLQFGFGATQWGRLQQAMWTYHRDLEWVKPGGKPIHPYLSRAWQWILTARPVAYFYEDTDGIRREILSMGNPVIFWTSVVAVPFAALRWWRVRDWAAGFVTVAVLVQYVPWFAVARPQFLFYLVPVVPFFVLAVVVMLRSMWDYRMEPGSADEQVGAIRPLAPLVIGVVALAVLAFIWFWPILVGQPLSIDGWAGWRTRIWFDGSPWQAFNWV